MIDGEIKPCPCTRSADFGDPPFFVPIAGIAVSAAGIELSVALGSRLKNKNKE
jgi:hypothetical protein